MSILLNLSKITYFVYILVVIRLKYGFPYRLECFFKLSYQNNCCPLRSDRLVHFKAAQDGIFLHVNSVAPKVYVKNTSGLCFVKISLGSWMTSLSAR